MKAGNQHISGFLFLTFKMTLDFEFISLYRRCVKADGSTVLTANLLWPHSFQANRNNAGFAMR